MLAIPFLVGCVTPIAPVSSLSDRAAQLTTWRYSQFIQAVKSGQVTHVAISADRTFAIATTRQKQSFCINLSQNPTLIDTLVKHNIDISVLPERVGAKRENDRCQ